MHGFLFWYTDYMQPHKNIFAPMGCKKIHPRYKFKIYFVRTIVYLFVPVSLQLWDTPAVSFGYTTRIFTPLATQT